MVIDTHAHLNDDKLYVRADKIVADMQSDNLAAIINVGYDEESSLRAFELSKRYEKMFAIVGIHPHDAKAATQDIYDKIVAMTTDKKVLAIGEIGLDYYYDLSPREVQQKVFLEQLVIASELKLPVSIHLRDGYGDMLKLLSDNKKYTESGILFHCYSGSKEVAAELSKRYDAYFAFGGAITFKNATDKPEIIRSIPTDRILVETDCPYMTPVPYRGTDNEPKYVNLVVKRLAEIWEKSVEETENITVKNTKEFFKKINDCL